MSIFSSTIIILLTIRMKMYSELNWRFFFSHRSCFFSLHQHQIKSASFNNKTLNFRMRRSLRQALRSSRKNKGWLHAHHILLNQIWISSEQSRVHLEEIPFLTEIIRVNHTCSTHVLNECKTIFTNQFTSQDSPPFRLSSPESRTTNRSATYTWWNWLLR